MGDTEDVEKLLKRVKSDNGPIGSIDFNKILPVPEALKIESTPSMLNGLRSYKNFLNLCCVGSGDEPFHIEDITDEQEKAYLTIRRDLDENTWKIGKQAFDNVNEYGYPSAYEWCIANWGTDRPAIDCELEGKHTLKFTTAETNAYPVIKALSRKFPYVYFSYAWASEEIGVRVGEAEFENGDTLYENMPDGRSRSAYDLAADIWDIDLDSEGYIWNHEKENYERLGYDIEPEI